MAGAVEDQIIEAVRQILTQLYALSPSILPHGRIAKVQREAIFYLYEGGEQGKWDSARPHSLAARTLRGAGVKGAALAKLVTYDHAIPLASLQADLREAAHSLEKMRVLLRSRVRAVVITREENERLRAAKLNDCLPASARPDDVMARYREVGIVLGPDDEAALTAPV